MINNLNAQLETDRYRIDSLKSIFVDADFRDKGKIALEIANIYPRGELDSSKRYINLSIDNAIKYEDDGLLAKAYVSKSWLFVTPLHQFDSTLYYAQNAIDLLDTSQYSKTLDRAYNNKAIALVQTGNSLEGLEYFKKSLKINKSINDSCRVATSLHNIAKVYKHITNVSEAIEYFKESLSMKILNNCSDNYAYIFFNLAGIFENLGESDSTIYYIHKTLEMDKKHGSIEHITPAMYVLGKMHLRISNLDSAKNYLYKAESLSLEQSNIGIRVFTLYELARYQKAINNPDSALYYIQEAQKYNQVSANLTISLDSLQYQIYKGKEDFVSALYYLEKYKVNSDSLQRDKVAIRLEEFQSENKANQIKILSQENRIIAYESQRDRSILFLLFTFLVFSFVFFAFTFYNNRKKDKLKLDLIEAKNNLKYEQLLSRSLRSQMNPHFIFNTLNSIKRFALFKERDETSQYITEFSVLIRNVLENSSEQFIKLSEEVSTLKRYITIEQKRFSERFAYEINIEEGFDLDYYKIPPLLLQPYTENAIWHGLMHKEGSKKLQINIVSIRNGFKCEIIDNGVGRAFHEPKRLNKSLGSKITHQRVEQLNKLFHISSSIEIIDLLSADNEPEGTKVIIVLEFLE